MQLHSRLARLGRDAIEARYGKAYSKVQIPKGYWPEDQALSHQRIGKIEC